MSIRYELNQFLAQFEDHIGYAVLSESRQRQYGAEALRLELSKLADTGLSNVLASRDKDDIPSVGVIENVGGILDDRVNRHDGEFKRRDRSTV